MKKKLNVYMKPSSEKAVYYVSLNTDLVIAPQDRTIPGLNYQHLYFTSNSSDDVKIGDHVFNTKTNEIYLVCDFNGIIPVDKNGNGSLFTEKIEITSDESLKLNSLKVHSDSDFTLEQIIKNLPSLPQPTQEFIKLYAKEHNKGNVITEVKSEYNLLWNNRKYKEQPFPDEFATETDRVYKLNVNPNNTVDIHLIVDKHSKEAIEILKNKLILLPKDEKIKILESVETFDMWIEENI